jgi:hypothetical protein
LLGIPVRLRDELRFQNASRLLKKSSECFGTIDMIRK